MAVLELLIACLKLSLLLGPFLAVVFTGGSSFRTQSVPGVDILFLLLVWIFTYVKAFGDDVIAGSYGVEADVYVTTLTVAKTAWIVCPTLDIFSNGNLLLWWLIPILGSVVYLSLYGTTSYGHLLNSNVGNSHQINKHFTLSDLLLMLGSISAWNVIRFVLYYTSVSSDIFHGIGKTYAYHTVLDTLIGCLIVLRLPVLQTQQGEEPWSGAGGMIPIYLAFQLSTLSNSNPSQPMIIVTLIGAFLLLCIASTMQGRTAGDKKQQQAGGRALRDKIFHIISYPFIGFVRVILNMLSNDRWLRIFYLFGLAQVLTSIYANKVWYTTTVSFPASLQTSACNPVKIVENEGRQFFEITNQEQVRNALGALGALPVVAKARGNLQSFIVNAYPHLVSACRGISVSVQPGNSFVILVSVLLGPMYVAVWILLQLFPSVEQVASSRNFWKTALGLSIIHLISTQFVADADATMWSLAVDGTSTRRSYTDDGSSALAAQLFMCLCVFLICFFKLRGENKRSTLSRNLGHAVDYVTSPSFLCLGGGVAFFVLGVIAGSPLRSFGMERNEKYKASHPAWSQTSASDKFENQLATITSMISHEFLIGMYAVKAARSAMNSAGCKNYCIGSLCQEICVWDLVSGGLDALTSLVEGVLTVGLNAGLNAVMIPLSNALGGVGGIGGLDSMLTKFKDLDAFSSFDLLNVNTNLNLNLKLNLNTSYLSISWIPWVLLGLVLVLFLAKILGSQFPTLSLLETSLTWTILSILLSSLVYIAQIQRTVDSYGYAFFYTFSPSAVMYGLAFMLIAASVVLSDSSVHAAPIKKGGIGGGDADWPSTRQHQHHHHHHHHRTSSASATASATTPRSRIIVNDGDIAHEYPPENPWETHAIFQGR